MIHFFTNLTCLKHLDFEFTETTQVGELLALSGLLRASNALSIKNAPLLHLRQLNVRIICDEFPGQVITDLVTAIQHLEHLVVRVCYKCRVRINDYVHSINNQNLVIGHPWELESLFKASWTIPRAQTLRFTYEPEDLEFEETVLRDWIPRCLPALQELDMTMWSPNSRPTIDTVLSLMPASIRILRVDGTVHEMARFGALEAERLAQVLTNKSIEKLVFVEIYTNRREVQDKEFKRSRRLLRKALLPHRIQLETTVGQW